MKGLVYKGARSVAVEDVPDARIEEPLDAVIRITTTNICGSDLHMYEGRAAVEEGKVLGHENMGVVDEVGAGRRPDQGRRPGVGAVQHRLRHLPELQQGWTSFCLRVNPSGAWTAPRTATRTWARTRAARPSTSGCPYADFNLLELPAGAGVRERLHDAVRHLPDRLPRHRTGRGGAGRQRRGLRRGPGRPDGGAQRLPAGRVAGLRRSTRSPTGWRWPARSVQRRSTSPTAIRSTQIMDATDGRGVDRGVEAVGYQAHDPSGHEHPELVLDNLVAVVRATGAIGVVGVYVPEDPGARDGAGEGGPARLGLRHLLHQGPAHGHRAGAGQAVQPAAARPDHRGRARPRSSSRTSCPWPRRRAATRTSTSGWTAGRRCCCTLVSELIGSVTHRLGSTTKRDPRPIARRSCPAVADFGRYELPSPTQGPVRLTQIATLAGSSTANSRRRRNNG